MIHQDDNHCQLRKEISYRAKVMPSQIPPEQSGIESKLLSGVR